MSFAKKKKKKNFRKYQKITAYYKNDTSQMNDFNVF